MGILARGRVRSAYSERGLRLLRPRRATLRARPRPRRRSGSTPHEVEDAFRRLHDAHALVLEPGTAEIRMLNPFSAVETPHRVHADGRDWYANCAWDALGHPGRAARRTASSSRACPDCGEQLELEVRDGELVRGADAARPLRRPGAALVGRHRLHLKHDGLPPVGGAPRRAGSTRRGGSRARPSTAAQLNELARRWWRTRLDPDWRPRTRRRVAGDPRRAGADRASSGGPAS